MKTRYFPILKHLYDVFQCPEETFLVCMVPSDHLVTFEECLAITIDSVQISAKILKIMSRILVLSWFPKGEQVSFWYQNHRPVNNFLKFYFFAQNRYGPKSKNTVSFGIAAIGENYSDTPKMLISCCNLVLSRRTMIFESWILLPQPEMSGYDPKKYENIIGNSFLQ